MLRKGEAVSERNPFIESPACYAQPPSRNIKLRLAISNSWPNLQFSAEREFIARLKMACQALGWECVEVVTSDEILQSGADCVILTHEFQPKLTKVPTIGLIWSPPDFYRNDLDRVKTILSYDGYFAGSSSVREYLTDLLFSTGKDSPVSEWNFLPTAARRSFRAPDLKDPSLFYTGVHWDGNRHEELIKGLCANLPVAFYGDPAKWSRFGKAYRGSIPFDGVSIFDRIREAGVALCLHRDEHLKHDVPSMRIFEAAAASAVLITENSNFAKSNFGDSVLYVEADSADSVKLGRIREHFEWIRSHPSEAKEMAFRSNAIFNEKFALEHLLSGLPEFLQRVRRAGYFEVDARENPGPKVEVIVRVGGRDLSFIERCLDSLAEQSHSNLGLILVSYGEVAGLDHLLGKYGKRFVSVKRISSEATGYRSTSLWDGIRAVDADYFCNQDDDDTIHPNHIRSLVEQLEAVAGSTVAYSGCIQVQDEPGHYYHQPNFTGPIGAQIRESRQIVFFDRFERKRMLRFDNFVQSNAWLARRSLLQGRDLTDPKLTVAEDMYLYFLFLRRGDFTFSWRVTANWHWRSGSKDNSMLRETCFPASGERVKLRTMFFGLEQELGIVEVVGDRAPLSCRDVLRPFVNYGRRVALRIWKKTPFQRYSRAAGVDLPDPGKAIDFGGTRYPAELADGIAFDRDGYPSFVAGVSGISEKEGFGRWTDGSRAVIEFTHPLPKKFTLEIKTGVFVHLLNKPIKIAVGDVESEIRLAREDVTEILIPISTDGTAKSVAFEIPDARSPKELGGTSDTRRLGLALVRIGFDKTA